MGDPVTTAIIVGGGFSFLQSQGIFGGGDTPSPADVSPPPTRVEPGEKVSSRFAQQKKKRKSLATQINLSEPLIKEEKLGT